MVSADRTQSPYPSGPPTIVDVARAAGVSVSTVSRVLNDRKDVAEATRRRVRAAIDALGFTPDVTARRLVSSRTRALALLFPPAHAALTTFDLDFVVGAAAAAAARDHVLSLFVDEPSDETLLDLYRGHADGAVLMQIRLHDRRVDLLAERGLPFVMIGRTEELTGLSFVDFDFEAAVAALYAHLAALGHRRIALLGRPTAQVEIGLGPAVRCLAGFARAAAELGLPALQVPTDLDPLAAAQATHHLLDVAPDLSAVVTTGGTAAHGVIRALRERGRAVPANVSVVGIATNRLAELTDPPLSGIAFPSAEIGQQAVGMLVRHLDDRRQGRPPRVEQILVPANLVIRGSADRVRDP